MRRARGQALVLGALCMLLLVLMVLVTLSLGFRARDRVELQIAADAAAYTEAVDVARAYNEIALMNRAQIALEVAALAMGSLMSWTSHHYSNLVALEQGLSQIHGEYVAECCPLFCPCPCSQIGPSAASLQAASQERQRVAQLWDPMEKAAAQQMRSTWLAAEDLFNQSRDVVNRQLSSNLIQRQRRAGAIAALASSELVAPAAGDEKNGRELAESLHLSDDDRAAHQSVQLMMGTRDWDFTTMRRGGYAPIREKLEPLAQTGNAAASAAPAFREGEGGTTHGRQRHDQAARTASPQGSAWAEDHGGSLSLSWPAGSCSKSASPHVRDTLLAAAGRGSTGARHDFTPGDDEPARDRHALGSDPRRNFPNVLSFAFPQLEQPENDFGQPKLYALLTRDYRRVPPKPWDLRFAFRFGETPAGFGPSSGVQQQVGVGSSLVYYHRPGAWAEPPNLFNPFWRATLVAPDDDLGAYVRGAGFGAQGDTVHRLLAQGLKGTR